VTIDIDELCSVYIDCAAVQTSTHIDRQTHIDTEAQIPLVAAAAAANIMGNVKILLISNATRTDAVDRA